MAKKQPKKPEPRAKVDYDALERQSKLMALRRATRQQREIRALIRQLARLKAVSDRELHVLACDLAAQQNFDVVVSGALEELRTQNSRLEERVAGLECENADLKTHIPERVSA